MIEGIKADTTIERAYTIALEAERRGCIAFYGQNCFKGGTGPTDEDEIYQTWRGAEVVAEALGSLLGISDEALDAVRNAFIDEAFRQHGLER